MCLNLALQQSRHSAPRSTPANPPRPSASWLPQAAIDTARRERRVGSCSLHVDPANTPAVGLYASLGFAIEAELQVGAADSDPWGCKDQGVLC
jgi:hypothetical protein